MFNIPVSRAAPRIVKSSGRRSIGRQRGVTVKSSPGKAVEPSRDVGFHNKFVRPAIC